ncbi:hypothetical protein [Devosia sp. MC1541]|uniref:hypothetical protein n=1 Tax=Devosia sp. MC1541 TaxID=2725264 RepID=UPI00145FB307|nr:hypothetical protein [Devosia sp. MC1541]
MSRKHLQLTLVDWIAAAGIEDGTLIPPLDGGTAWALHMAGFSISRLPKPIAKRAGSTQGPYQPSAATQRVGAAPTRLVTVRICCVL